MALNENIKGALFNWKFTRARGYLDADCTTEEVTLIVALSDMFGDAGWPDGGHMAVIIAAALKGVGI